MFEASMKNHLKGNLVALMQHILRATAGMCTNENATDEFFFFCSFLLPF